MIINGSINTREMSERIPENYKGWKVWSLQNKWLKLHIAPQLGGRIIQMVFNQYPFFFVNPDLEGREPEGNNLGEKGSWLNFGGEKIWPAPQGWDSPNAWPGPPDPVLDSGNYTVSKTENNANHIRLTSLKDQYTGLQIVKDVFVSTERAETIVDATFINISQEPREWSVWPVFQMNTIDPGIEGQYRVTCPLNARSRFEKGFKEMHGIVNNPQNRVDEWGNLVVDYQYLIGKVGLDSKGNWVAFTDRKSGKVFVTVFEHRAHAQYPEDTSVQIWTQGRGMTFSRNRINEYPDDFRANPPYMEIELLSPLYKLQPEQKASFKYRILASTIPKDAGICTTNDNGVIAEPLRVFSENGSVRITGQFGVFGEGCLKLVLFEEENGRNSDRIQLSEWEVSPLAGIAIDFVRKSGIELSGSPLFQLLFFDRNGTCCGVLDETKLC